MSARNGEATSPGDPAVTAVASRIEIRPIRANDQQALEDGFERLSDSSRYRRFLSPHQSLTPAELRYLTDIDHHDHEALVAIDRASGHGVGVARYVRSRTDPALAELAVAVSDDWQGQGVGTRLCEALAERARSEGVKSFTALMLADNDLMLNLIAELGVLRDVRREQGTVGLTVDLPDQSIGNVSRLMRATARGEMDAAGAAR